MNIMDFIKIRHHKLEISKTNKYGLNILFVSLMRNSACNEHWFPRLLLFHKTTSDPVTLERHKECRRLNDIDGYEPRKDWNNFNREALAEKAGVERRARLKPIYKVYFWWRLNYSKWEEKLGKDVIWHLTQFLCLPESIELVATSLWFSYKEILFHHLL